MHTHEGGCHCGNLRWSLATALSAAELPVRACQCTFCRKKGALSTSDPSGVLRFTVRDPAALLGYRFGTRSADFLVCARCGTYVGAVMDERGRRYGIVNIRSHDAQGDAASRARPMDYSGEDADARRARPAAGNTGRPSGVLVRTRV